MKPAAIEEEEIITLQPNIDTKQSNTSNTEIQATMTEVSIDEAKKQVVNRKFTVEKNTIKWFNSSREVVIQLKPNEYIIPSEQVHKVITKLEQIRYCDYYYNKHEKKRPCSHL